VSYDDGGCSWVIKEIELTGTLDAVRTLMQRVCSNVPDRAEYRAKISQVGALC